MTPIVDEAGMYAGVTCQDITITPMQMIVDIFDDILFSHYFPPFRFTP